MIESNFLVVNVEQDWFFTFRLDDPEHSKCYVIIYSTYDIARLVMLKKYGTAWAFQYPNADEAGVDRYGLACLERIVVKVVTGSA